MRSTVKVLVVDDSALTRQMLTRALAIDPSIEVVGSARTGVDAIEKCHALRPDVVTLDIEMPIMDGLEALRQIIETNPKPVIMMSVLTQHGAEAAFREADSRVAAIRGRATALVREVTGDRAFGDVNYVFPTFVTERMPVGLVGLIIAAIFAAALSSSLNSIASTAVNDLYKPFAKDKSDKQLMRIAGILTVVVGIIQIAIAVALKDANSSALNMALAVASLINGPILGVFLVGAFLKRAKEVHALAGMVVSIVLMTYVLLASNKIVPGPVIAFLWYALIGSLTTVLLVFLATLSISGNKDQVPN